MKFKGGTSVDSKGYLKFTAGPHRGKRVHIFVAEQVLGRKLTKDETLHHRDFNLLNPDWSNLLLIGRREHGFISNRQRWFLNNRDMKELAAYQQWIEQGGVRPDLAVAAFDEQDTSFNVSELEQPIAAAPPESN